MGLKDILENALKRPPTESDFATHIVDSICAQDQIQRIARNEGDPEQFVQSVEAVKRLKQQAREIGLTRQKYPSLYKRF